jgi:hypothetical protein
MTDRYPHAGWCSVHGAYDAPLAPGACTCGAEKEQSAFEAGKREGLEEAAKVADTCPDAVWGPWCSERIRALKETNG